MKAGTRPAFWPEELLEAVADHFRRHVVEIGFQHPDFDRPRRKAFALATVVRRRTTQQIGLIEEVLSIPARRPMLCTVIAGASSVHSLAMEVARWAALVGVVSSASDSRRGPAEPPLMFPGPFQRRNGYDAVGRILYGAVCSVGTGAAGEVSCYAERILRAMATPAMSAMGKSRLPHRESRRKPSGMPWIAASASARRREDAGQSQSPGGRLARLVEDLLDVWQEVVLVPLRERWM